MRLLRIGRTPVKGTRHGDVDRVRIEAQTVLGDRLFAVLDEARRRVLRTVEQPSLLAVVADWDGATLSLSLPDGRAIHAVPRDTGRRLAVDYWGRTESLDVLAGGHAELLSSYLGFEVRLGRAAPNRVVYGEAVSILTTGELAELAGRVGRPVDAHAFRANLILELDRALEPGERVAIGGVRLEICGPIPRCAVIDRDPRTGARAAALLKPLGGYRRGADGIHFGVDARVLRPGEVAVGDEAHVEPHPPTG